MPPLICPIPGPRGPGRDCPLYDQRVLTEDEQLRRALLGERRKTRTLASLVWADLNRAQQRPELPSPLPSPTFPHVPQKEEQP